VLEDSDQSSPLVSVHTGECHLEGDQISGIAWVPGIGPITARTLIAELPELGLLDRRRIAAWSR
jgi:transposase